jgi:PAS domain S-box-containing protein
MAYETTQAERGSELPLLLALHAAEIGVWEYDVQRQKLTWDARIRQGIEVETDAEPDWNDGILPNVHPDDRPKAIEAFLSLIQAGAGGTLTVECRMIGRRTGQISWVALSAISVPAKDDGLRLIGTARNITAERLASDELRRVNEQLEERVAEVVAERQVFADMFESSDDPAAAVDNDLRFVAMNSAYSKAFRRLFGVRLRVGDKLTDALAHMPPARDAAEAVWTRALNGEVVDIPRSGGDPNGSWHDIKFRPLRDRKGRTIGAFQYSRDVTQRVRATERLREAQTTLQRAQRMEAIGQLTGGIAHDFNNLLTVIAGNLEMLEASLNDAPQREMLREAQDAVQDGAKLTAQLLAFGRRQPLNPKPTDVGPLVSNFAELLRRTLGESIELSIITTGSAHLAVVDAPQLQNALLNLVINARDAMPDGGRLTIEISHARLDADYAQTYADVRTGRYVLIAVTDTGEGMSEDVRERAFEPFFTTKPTGAGTGLGLSMVYGFVKQSGGNIQLDSELGGGATVRVFLPLAEALRNATEPGRGKADRDVMPGGSETILLVEDDPRLRRVASRRLRSLGYQVIEADNGANALTLLAAHPEIAMIFTDFVMPGGMNGNELAEAAFAAKPAVKILFTSGYAEPAARGKLRAGVWLRKPYTAIELAKRIRDVLGEPTA